ncbi:MAG: hypothetical protein K1X92_04720 [Bacteroidia bacterium]|nr:hypothetical protein [Bacteroidia bacterium]
MNLFPANPVAAKIQPVGITADLSTLSDNSISFDFLILMQKIPSWDISSGFSYFKKKL